MGDVVIQTAEQSLAEIMQSLESSRICKEVCQAMCCKKPNGLLSLTGEKQKERLEKSGAQTEELKPVGQFGSHMHEGSFSVVKTTKDGCTQLEHNSCRVYGDRPLVCNIFPARPEIFLNFKGPVTENHKNKISRFSGSDYELIGFIHYYSKGNISMVPGLTLVKCPLSESMSTDQQSKYLMNCTTVLSYNGNMRVFDYLPLANLRGSISVLNDTGNYNSGFFPTLEERLAKGQILGYKGIEGYEMTPQGLKVLA